jgi:hypothetical protein
MPKMKNSPRVETASSVPKTKFLAARQREFSATWKRGSNHHDTKKGKKAGMEHLAT